ncbi:Glyoxalase family protein [Lysobacter dokdonensis DS-58]|uniref:Glyoxalase family protein n=1 Tax=Lysobacter dokdonensis DS-58 TaxID=1300345 RepID=A0A0A2WGR8_9GAMM|nr:VOC family protein [Lysobacter dokdonensis]KGQ18973.1 Glyoxalase family protein [Lysobacter dokdonensis DS-58]
MSVHSINHVTIVVRDMTRTARLFVDALDAREVYRSADKEYSKYPEVFLQIGNAWLVVMQDPEAVRARSYDHVALSLDADRFDEIRSRLRSAGAEVVPSRPRIAVEGESIYFYDFDNHLFELHAGDLGERLRHYAAGKHIRPETQ